MADDIQKEEVIEEVVETPEEPASDSSSTEEIDYRELAEAERNRADAAEALIIKNKKIGKRTEGGEEPITREEILALIEASKEEKDDSEEQKALAAAQARVKELTGKSAEIARALKAKDGISQDTTSTQRDGLPKTEPKLPDGSPLKAFKYLGQGLYAKKLSSGKTMYINTKATGGDRKKWVA